MSRMSGPEDFPFVDLFTIGGRLRRFKLRALHTVNYPDYADHPHLVLFRAQFPHLSFGDLKRVEAILSGAGMTAIRQMGGEHEVFFTFPEFEKFAYRKNLPRAKFEQADLMDILREIEDANFLVHGLTTMLHEPPPLEHVTFTVTFHGVEPSGREPVQEIVQSHGFAVIGGGTYLGDPPESDVQFWWGSTRTAYMRKVGRE